MNNDRSYNVERDIERAEAYRRAHPAEIPNAGLLISPRAMVLIEHLVRAHQYVMATGDVQAPDMITTTRRLMEYLAALEAVALVPFSAEPWDMPGPIIGLAAASLEGMVNVYTPAAAGNQTVAEGVAQFRNLADRLRRVEQRIGNVPGQVPAMEPPLMPPNAETPGGH